MSINTQNAKQIRDPMDVYAGISSRSDVDLVFSISGNVAAQDTDVDTALDTETWSMRNLADLQGAGFPLDGTRELYDSTLAASLDDGKLGIRTDIGDTVTIDVTAGSSIEAVTIEIKSGTGTIAANGVTYTARKRVVIPVNGLTIQLVCTSDNAYERLEIASITPGVTLEFDNSNIVSCVLDLRTSLEIVNPTWQVSTIEISAYWSDDISEAVSNIGDNVPIWYYAGYSDDNDFSDTRFFYLSEAVTQKDNLLTIKGEDSSHLLEDSDSVPITRLGTKALNGRKKLYNWFVSLITGAGITPTYIETAPSEAATPTTARDMVMLEGNPKEHVQSVMRLAHTGTFWPVYVDAGIPKITWTKPTSKWDIYETECGEVTKRVERNIAKITTGKESEYGLLNTLTRANAWTVLKSNISVVRGKKYTYNFSDAWYWTYKVDGKLNNKFTWSLINSVQWTSAINSYKKGSTWYQRPTLYGKKLTNTVNKRTMTESTNRPGYTAKITPVAVGRVYQGTTLIYPNYENLFAIKNTGGSFRWKGDPRMQPYDVATYHYADGTTKTITLASIQLRHEAGGTYADIEYRDGVV